MAKVVKLEKEMAHEIILITGGARSGKSAYAEGRAALLGSRRLYVATAEAGDDEMAQRIAAHQKRRGDAWTTVEEPVQLAETLIEWRGRADCALVDCLTLWLSNLLLRGTPDRVEDNVAALAQTLPRLDFSVVLVTNEVGAGIVPDNPLARQFRDLAGRVNQRIAALATEVVLMVAGLPMIMKRVDRCS
jgi:adenosylcobinamide kinase / adenosylcobinamide-phosphate guanylyltransferase